MDLTVTEDPNEGKPLRSWSQFSMYMRCPELYRAVYIDRTIKRQANVKMYVGSAVHAAHEALCIARIAGEEPTEDIAIKAAESYWNNGLSKLNENMTTLALERNTMLKVTKVYSKFFIDSDIAPTHTEQNVLWYPKGYPFGVRMIIDRIDKGGILVDLKTSAKSPPKNRVTKEHYILHKSGYDLQLDIYLWGMREVLNINPTQARLEVVVKSKTPKVVKVNHRVDSSRMNSVLDLMANLEENIQKGNFLKNRLSDYCSENMCANWEPCTGLKVEV